MTTEKQQAAAGLLIAQNLARQCLTFRDSIIIAAFNGDSKAFTEAATPIFDAIVNAIPDETDGRIALACLAAALGGELQNYINLHLDAFLAALDGGKK